MTIESSVKTSTWKKSQARKNVLEFVKNYPDNVVPFEVIENKVYEECKDMAYIECFGVFSRVLRDLKINLGSNYIK